MFYRVLEAPFCDGKHKHFTIHDNSGTQYRNLWNLCCALLFGVLIRSVPESSLWKIFLDSIRQIPMPADIPSIWHRFAKFSSKLHHKVLYRLNRTTVCLADDTRFSSINLIWPPCPKTCGLQTCNFVVPSIVILPTGEQSPSGRSNIACCRYPLGDLGNFFYGHTMWGCIGLERPRDLPGTLWELFWSSIHPWLPWKVARRSQSGTHKCQVHYRHQALPLKVYAIPAFVNAASSSANPLSRASPLTFVVCLSHLR